MLIIHRTPLISFVLRLTLTLIAVIMIGSRRKHATIRVTKTLVTDCPTEWYSFIVHVNIKGVNWIVYFGVA